jgi:hypothetical protein
MIIMNGDIERFVEDRDGRFMRDTGDWNDIEEHQGEILGDRGMHREMPDERSVRDIGKSHNWW